MYTSRILMYMRAITPVHVGVGRGYGVHVDLPVQRDEFGFPTIWSSSLKGAIKSRFPKLRQCLGPEPGELETAQLKQSSIAFADAKLILVPARVLSGVYTYVTSPHLLEGFMNYLRVVGVQVKTLDRELTKKLNEGKAVVSTEETLRNGRLMVNELDVQAEYDSELNEKLGITNYLPQEVLERIRSRGLALVPDRDNLSLTVVNRSMLIQYRVRLRSDTKTVEEGPWSEEYIPAETVLASLVLCTDRGNKTPGSEEVSCSNIFKREVDGKIMFVGGKETIGRGLVKLYLYSQTG
ncbi:MAG: type III-B CRISPR module RAMP protein Cmr4 [Sulfolobales archaeon]